MFVIALSNSLENRGVVEVWVCFCFCFFFVHTINGPQNHNMLSTYKRGSLKIVCVVTVLISFFLNVSMCTAQICFGRAKVNTGRIPNLRSFGWFPRYHQ